MKKLLIMTLALLFAGGARAVGQTGTFLDRAYPSDVRLCTYNVNWDSIFPDDDPNNHSWRAFERVQEFRRVIAAINPDVMCLQEINADRDPQDVAYIFNYVLPLPGGGSWHATIGNSNVTVSRYPLSMIADQTVPPGQRSQSMCLVDLPDVLYDRDLYVINEHFKCCGGSSNEAKRQKQADALVNWMRDARTPGESIDLLIGTPIIVLGDLNIVEGPGPVVTLVTGDIVDEATYGGDSPPDWDGSDDTDTHPLHNVSGQDDYTWRSDGSGFEPGRLDYVILSDSVALIAHRFVLNTTAMSPAELTATGLLEYDVVLDPPGRFDHLPVVVDLRFTPDIQPDGDLSLDGQADGRDIGWFAELAAAGASGDPLRIAHADYNANGIVDLDDISGFLGDLLAP